MKAFQICIVSKPIHPFSGNSHRMYSIKTRELTEKEEGMGLREQSKGNSYNDDKGRSQDGSCTGTNPSKLKY